MDLDCCSSAAFLYRCFSSSGSFSDTVRLVVIRKAEHKVDFRVFVFRSKCFTSVLSSAISHYDRRKTKHSKHFSESVTDCVCTKVWKLSHDTLSVVVNDYQVVLFLVLK